MDIGSIGGAFAAGNRPSGVGKSENKDFLEELLASLDLELDAFLNEEGTLDTNKLAQALYEEGSISGQMGPPAGRGGPPDFNSDEFQAMFVQQFGEEALAAIKNDDGTVNTELLEAFMEEQGIPMGRPQMGDAGGGNMPPPPPMTGAPQGGQMGAPLGLETLAALLEMLSVNADSSEEDGAASTVNVLTS
ncbi:MAG: hypothetical protein AB8B77_06350 [Alphaproteobacteria bacterium]